jgi:hypothetical protein
MTGATWAEWITAAGEWAIAIVLGYEVFANRPLAFVQTLEGDLTSDRRLVASRIWVQPPIPGNRCTGRFILTVPRPSRPPAG